MFLISRRDPASLRGRSDGCRLILDVAWLIVMPRGLSSGAASIWSLRLGFGREFLRQHGWIAAVSVVCRGQRGHSCAYVDVACRFKLLLCHDYRP